MPSFWDLLPSETLDSLRIKVVGYCLGAGVKVTNWVVQGVANQMVEAFTAALKAQSDATAVAIRGFASLDTAVDPGDPDPYNPGNESLAPEPGYLSEQGENVHGVKRGQPTFAAGPVVFSNAGPSSRNIAPNGLAFTYTDPSGETFSYRNVEDDTVYTNPDGTVTVAANTSVTLDVECNTIGASGSVPSGQLVLTTTLLGCSATNINPIIGTDRQDSENYREICRAASARLSLNGPGSAYEFLARRNLDGSELLRASNPPEPVAISRVWVSPDSDTGIVDVYYASAQGAAIDLDVAAANKNIQMQACAVMDTITFTGSAAVETNVHVQGTARIKTRPGLTAEAVVSGILASLIAKWPGIPIGGFDRDATGAGSLYRNDVESMAYDGYAGLYAVNITSMSDSVAIARGRVAKLQCVAADWTVTLVP